MKKFWRSGMIDKRVVAEKEWSEHINRIKMAMLESSRERYRVKYGNNKPYYFKLADDYDEVRVGDNVTLDFGNDCIICAPRDSVSQALLDFNKQFITTRPKTPVKDAILDAYSYWAKKECSDAL